MKIHKVGGDERIRTADLPRAKRTLYQLSYIPENIFYQMLNGEDSFVLLTMPT